MTTDFGIKDEYLKNNLIKYPASKTQDIVKFLYQKEFGGEHLVEDPESSLKWLKSEIKSLNLELKQSLFDSLSNDLVRVNLVPFAINSISKNSLDKDIILLNDVFVESSRLVKGDLNNFKKSLGFIKDDDFLINYDFSPVHHSKEYSNTYYPAYRVIKLEIYKKYFS
jgi:hypothetical protein